jgi:DNA polymerase IV
MYLASVDPFAERIAHVDIDAFFVEVERLRRPDLVARPVLIGGDGPRSVVAAASYEARAAGAHSAMPMGQAKRLCPGAVVIPPDHREYRRLSEQVMEVLESFTPRCEPISVDEAFLDIGGLGRAYAEPREVGEAIRTAIREGPGLPASVGLATSKFVAKMASRSAKPDGLVVVAAGAEIEFLHPHPVRALWGVGEVTLARLEELGVGTVGDLASFPRDTLVRRLGASAGGSLWDLASVVDAREVEAPVAAKSVSVEETYPVDLVGHHSIDRALLELADRLASRLRRQDLLASTVQVKVRFSDFTTLTRAHTLDRPTLTARDLLAEGRRLLDGVAGEGVAVRLLGMGAAAVVPADAPRQLGFGDDGWEAVEEAVERARERFGPRAVSRARIAPGDVESPDAQEDGLGILGMRSSPETPHAPR